MNEQLCDECHMTAHESEEDCPFYNLEWHLANISWGKANISWGNIEKFLATIMLIHTDSEQMASLRKDIKTLEEYFSNETE